jgi:glycosyltransferase involved in cell wall biosynthesis
MTSPVISVIMSVYNGSAYLKDAIESILYQTYTNFEFIIINDASTDDSLKIIESYTDERLVLKTNDKNLGLTKSLNKGISLAKGKYIARMDCDDISLPERFQKQFSFFQENEDITVCGTNYQFIGGSTSNLPLDNDTLKIKLFQGKNLIAHPSVMFRREIFDDHNIEYDESVKYAQDFKLWVDISQKFKIANVVEPLLKYRVHNQQISSTKPNQQKKVVMSVCIDQLVTLVKNPTSDNIKLHKLFVNEAEVKSVKDLSSLQNWVNRLIAENNKKKVYDTVIFKYQLLNSLKAIKVKYFTKNYLRTKSYSTKLLPTFFSIRYQVYKHYSLKVNIGFLIKCIISYRTV